MCSYLYETDATLDDVVVDGFRMDGRLMRELEGRQAKL